MLVLAGAGSGKTRVLVHRVAYLISACGIPPESILAVTFTNKAAGELRERVEKLLGPDAAGVWVGTFHSTCVRILRREAGHLGLSRGFAIYDEGDALATVKEALRRRGRDPKTSDPKRLRWRIDQWKNAGVLPARASREATDLDGEEAAETYAVYQRLLREANALDFGDLILQVTELFERFPQVLEHYQRRWQYVLVDEYQDTNKVQYQLVSQLVRAHSNLCVVGDANQCLPPSAKIATSAGERRVDEIQAGEAVVAGGGWGSATTAPIGRVVSRPYFGPMLSIRMRSGRVLEATPNHLCFGRLDPVRGLHYVYLMWSRGLGYRIGVTSGVRSTSDGTLVNGIQMRASQEVADRAWILRASNDSREVRFYEQLYAARYGLPTCVFHVRGRRMALTQDHIDRLFQEIDTEIGANQLLDDLYMDPRYPHHHVAAVVRGDFDRKIVWFTMFGDPRPHVLRPWHEHRIQLVTSDPGLREAATAAGFPVRDGSRGTWRIETSRKHHDAALDLSESICALGGLHLVSRARLTREKAYLMMPASHLREGMAVPVLDGEQVIEDIVEGIEQTQYDGEVFDLSVEDLRNYSANGVIVHNSIYGWRGADVRNILDFERDYPDAKVVALDRNYRSRRPILEGASAVVANNGATRSLKLRAELGDGEPIRFFEALDERSEAGFVIREILTAARRDGRSFGDFAIFYRTNAMSRPFEDELLRYDVPYVVVGGVRFYERAEVKDALAYLRLALNPADSAALRRIVNAPARGIGKTTIVRADEIAEREAVPTLEGLRRFADSRAAGRAARPIREFLGLIDELGAQVRGAAPSEAIARVLQKSGYLAALEREGTPEAEARLENLRELVASAEDFVAESVEADEPRSPIELFLDQVALVSDVDQWDRRAERVSLMTVHAAKGLEFPVVFVVGLEEGIFPHAASARDDSGLEEERRLFYVAMTRAMERLYLSCAQERRRYGSHAFAVPSRFLREIPAEVLQGDVPESRDAPRFGGGRRDDAGLDYSYAQSEPEGGGAAIPRGLRVRHPVFGAGTVQDVSGAGAGQKLRIRFDRVGLKTLVLRFANLEPL